MEEKFAEEGLRWIERPWRLDLAKADCPDDDRSLGRVQKHPWPAVALTGAVDGSFLRSHKGGGLVRLVYAGTQKSAPHHAVVRGKRVPAFTACGLWVRRLLKGAGRAWLLKAVRGVPWYAGKTDEETEKALLALCDVREPHPGRDDRPGLAAPSLETPGARGEGP